MVENVTQGEDGIVPTSPTAYLVHDCGPANLIMPDYAVKR